MVSQTPTEYRLRPNTLTIPELEQSKAAVLNTLASVLFHTMRCRTWFHLKHRTSHPWRIAEVSGLSAIRKLSRNALRGSCGLVGDIQNNRSIGDKFL